MKEQIISMRGQFTVESFQQRFEMSFPIIKRMLGEKKTYRQIASETGLAASTISNYIGCSSELSQLAVARGQQRGGARR